MTINPKSIREAFAEKFRRVFNRYDRHEYLNSQGAVDDLNYQIDSLLEAIAVEVEAMNEQNDITQTILGAMENRGFYDAGKYLDGSIWERVSPLLTTIIRSHKSTS